jgi:hypothetical protein
MKYGLVFCLVAPLRITSIRGLCPMIHRCRCRELPIALACHESDLKVTVAIAGFEAFSSQLESRRRFVQSRIRAFEPLTVGEPVRQLVVVNECEDAVLPTDKQRSEGGKALVRRLVADFRHNVQESSLSSHWGLQAAARYLRI